MTALYTGLFAGLVHVVSGPDHIAAVAPLAAKCKRPDWALGMLWGIGHSLGVVVIGCLALLMREALAIEAIASGSERVIAILLIAMGVWGIHGSFARHRHNQAHGKAPAGGMIGKASIGIGMLHGVAGGAHLLGVLPVIAFPSVSEVLIYLGAYGLGTVLAMGTISFAVGGFARSISHNCGEVGAARLMIVCSVATLIVGGFWLVQ